MTEWLARTKTREEERRGRLVDRFEVGAASCFLLAPICLPNTVTSANTAKALHVDFDRVRYIPRVELCKQRWLVIIVVGSGKKDRMASKARIRSRIGTRKDGR